jgi:3-oxoadipate enol-lactonase
MDAHINGIRLVYTDTGRGLPAVLLHGFPLDRTMWDAQVKALSPQTRLIVPDLRGFGESESPPGPITMEQLADDVAALLDHLRIRKAVIAGLSMGGYVAFAFCRKHADRLRALVLCDTKAAADTPEAREARAETASLAAAQGMAPIMEWMLPRLLAPQTPARRPDVVDLVRRMILRAPLNGVQGALQGMAERPNSTSLLPAIRCPSLVLVGAHDVLSPPQEAAGMCAKLPDARLVVVPDAGHLAPLENPTASNAALEEFLGAIP